MFYRSMFDLITTDMARESEGGLHPRAVPKESASTKLTRLWTHLDRRWIRLGVSNSLLIINVNDSREIYRE